MKNMRTLFIGLALTLSVHWGWGQAIIAAQQFQIKGTNFRLTTYEKSVDGYKNVLRLESMPGDTGLIFYLMSLDAIDFNDLFWDAIRTKPQITGTENYSRSDYNEATKLFGAIVLAANFKDDRPIAGRMILKETILLAKRKPISEDSNKCHRNPQKPRTMDAINAMKMRLSDASLNEEQPASTTPSNAKILQAEMQKSTAEIIAVGDDLKEITNQLNELKGKIEVKFQAQSDQEKRVLSYLKDIQQQSISEPNSDEKGINYESLYQANKSLIAQYQQTIADVQRSLADNSEKEMGNQEIWNKIQVIENTSAEYFSKLEQMQKRQGEIAARINQNTAKGDMITTSIAAKIDSMRIEFNEGMIERIVVVAQCHEGKCTGETCEKCPQNAGPLVFTNHFPIGFSTMRNYANDRVMQQFLVDRSGNNAIALSELFTYIPNLRLNTRDFSPKDTAMTFFPSMKEYVLHRPLTSELLKARIYTDFVGLNESEPNGLIQTEIDKRINLYTFRRSVGAGRRFNYSFIQFVRPVFTLSKIDSKLRRLEVQENSFGKNGIYRPYKYTTTLELLQYENMSAGLDLNLFLFDSQPFKTTFFIHAGMRFGRVAFTDSLRVLDSITAKATGAVNNFGANTARVFPELTLTVYPEEAFSLSATYRPSMNFLMDRNLIQIPREKELLQENGKNAMAIHLVHTLELVATVKLSERGELYGRYRMHMLGTDLRTNFHQAQVGYSVFLTKKVSSQ
jgi:hypothetical protein